MFVFIISFQIYQIHVCCGGRNNGVQCILLQNKGDIVFVLKRDSIMGCKIHPPDHDDLSWDPTPLQGGLRQMCDNSQLIYKN